MDLLCKVLLVLSIWKNVGIFANGCSVFPDGSPSCFPDAPDASESNEKIKEIVYNKKGLSAEMNSHVINPNLGDQISLGEIYTETVGKSSDVVLCLRYMNEGAYVDAFETKCDDKLKFGREEDDGILKKVTDYFVITKKEVWNCQNEQGQITFSRIVTELLCKDKVGSILAPDGIIVKTVPIPFLGDISVSIPYYTAVVREVKYMNQETKTPLRFDGFLVLHKPENVEDEDLSMFKPLNEDGLQTDQGTGDFYKEVNYGPKRDLHKQCLVADPSKDKVLIDVDVLKGKQKIGSSNTKAECEINKEDKYLYHDYVLPEWSTMFWNEVAGAWRRGPIFAEAFKERFILTKQECWICKIEDSEEAFRRIVTEYVGKKAVDSIEYYDGSKVWQFALDDSSKSVGIRTVAYFKTDEPYKEYGYEGLIKLKKVKRKRDLLKNFLGIH